MSSRIHRTTLAVAAALCCVAVPSCAAGWLYSHTVVPLDTSYDATPVMGSSARGDVKQVTYSNLNVQWGKNGAGEIAGRAGFAEIFYIDVEVLEILSFWTQSWVHVYGIEAAEDDAPVLAVEAPLEKE
jgi:hypothetical protein